MIQLFYSDKSMYAHIPGSKNYGVDEFYEKYGNSLYDEYLVYQSGSNDEYGLLSSLKLTLEVNRYGVLEFTALPDSIFIKMYEYKGPNNVVSLYLNGDLIFKGFILDVEYSIDMTMKVTCVDLFFLIQNSLCQINKYIKEISGDPNPTIMNVINRCFSDMKSIQNIGEGSKFESKFSSLVCAIDTKVQYEHTNPILNDDSPYQYIGDVFDDLILNKFGGYMYLNYGDGYPIEPYPGEGNTNTYLWYLSGDSLTKNTSQIIGIDSNILDLKKIVRKSDIYNGVIGLSNDNNSIIQTSYAAFDFICFYELKNFNVDVSPSGSDGTKTLAGLTDDYFKKNISGKIPSTEIELSVFDKSFIDSSIDPIKIAQLIRIVSEKHGIDDYYICRKSVVDYLNPENSTYYFGNGSGGNISDLKYDYSSKIDSSTIYSRNSIVSLNNRVGNLGG